MNRAWGALAAAVVVTLAIGHLLRDSPGYMVHNPDGTTTGDITHYVYWTRLVTLKGVQASYSGRWPETYAVYPPLNLYAYAVVGTVYRLTQDPEFDSDRAQASLALREGIKFVALAMHVVTGLVIAWSAWRLWGRPTLAALTASVYLLNPAALYDVAHWGQPDGTHALFSVLAVGGLELGMVPLAWIAIALAVLGKPQACAIVPAIAFATARLRGIGACLQGVGVALVTAAIGVAPYVVTTRLPDLLSLPGTVSSVMPVVSADAHNFWWLVLASHGQDPLFVQETAHALGALSYRTLANGLVVAAIGLVCWLVWTRRVSLAEGAALSVLGWFTFTTQAHENHLFFALPLLSLAWPVRRSLLAPFIAVTIILLLNMFLHDQLVLERLGLELNDALIETARLANAGLAVATCLTWTLAAALRAPENPDVSATVNVSWPPRRIREKVPI
ncbi:MAG: hypothetical protein NVSMB2_22570 [Chloroflexota bacterium]